MRKNKTLKRIANDDAFTEENNRTIQQKKASAALVKAKKLEADRIAAGWEWISHPLKPRTRVFVSPSEAAAFKIQKQIKDGKYKQAI